MTNITKQLFLTTLLCPTKGWLTNKLSTVPISLSEKLHMEEGLEIHDRARNLFKDAFLRRGIVMKRQRILRTVCWNIVRWIVWEWLD